MHYMDPRPEIERKFLVTDLSCIEGSPSTRLSQAYLFDTPRSSIRVRIAHPAADIAHSELGRSREQGQPEEDEKNDYEATLTIKGQREGATRPEFECALPLDVAFELLRSTPYVIEKYRYPLFANGRIWAIDVFMGDNEGLVLAEIELQAEDDAFTKPDFCGDDVTDDERYYNSYLAKNPYRSW